MSGSGAQSRSIEYPDDGEFERAFTAFAYKAPSSAAMLFRQIEQFAKDPDAHGLFLRGASDGRVRYLVPKSLAQGVLEELVAVAEIEPTTNKVMLLRLYEVETAADAREIERHETTQAEQDYNI